MLPTGPDGSYRYTADLFKLDSHRQISMPPIDHRLSAISTPLHLHAWQKHLQHHPDPDFARYILQGIEFGFWIGVRDGTQFHSASQNMFSARQHPEVTTGYLDTETQAGWILGPYPMSSLPGIHISRFGVIKKKP